MLDYSNFFIQQPGKVQSYSQCLYCLQQPLPLWWERLSRSKDLSAFCIQQPFKVQSNRQCGNSECLQQLGTEPRFIAENISVDILLRELNSIEITICRAYKPIK